MNIILVRSNDELLRRLKDKKITYLLIYKEGSEKSDCAMKAIRETKADISDVQMLAANVAEVKDIHTHYNVTSAPTLVEFRDTNMVNQVKGCHSTEFFKGLIDKVAWEVESADKPQKRVTVYSTPTCPWCDTLKNYLRKHRIRFSDVDVSRDTSALQEMKSKSGQQGVPQTDIEGDMIIGFDQSRINRLLEIKSN